MKIEPTKAIETIGKILYERERNYKRALLMFFSDVFYWMETNVNMITNHLATVSDCPVETTVHIIRRRTACQIFNR